jgi:hypothetical protein
MQDKETRSIEPTENDIVEIEWKKRELVSEGDHTGIVAGIKNKGLTETIHGLKNMVTVIFQVTDQTGSHGQPMLLKLDFHKSLRPDSTLGKVLRQLGYGPLLFEGTKFKLNDIVGVKVDFTIQHRRVFGQNYERLVSIARQRAADTGEICAN